MSQATRASCFDASALLKRYVEEEGSEAVRTYWAREPTKFTTSLCFHETLTLLKVSHFYRKQLDRRQYRRATLDLCAWYDTVSKDIPELSFLSPTMFIAALRVSERHDLDLSDAFQIVSLKEGFFSVLSGESQTILVTGDEALAEAARGEGLRVWNVLREPAP
jgi:predicted nucleic acid-binding protein